MTRERWELQGGIWECWGLSDDPPSRELGQASGSLFNPKPSRFYLGPLLKVVPLGFGVPFYGSLREYKGHIRNVLRGTCRGTTLGVRV